ncbi:4'-phosphopantetheinyl transferase family protein [Halpernia frigidisoli]|uniref:4'-phosphopantetheinyl transferase superfamily protein n=1 Tax=Halpernia frigidisoli TaxID=1125876 RepID=A0A1I3F8P8_9FLAO|nr:4'-phosphopantetheinyl transferase family protein [Halpernia frigidisoli]SFI07579.1 4'-phosphopantetheinyl transferase superfamily protein [Halpernia frigidisoli]
MPFYKDFSDEKATILIWKFSDDEILNANELVEVENLEKIKNYHPTKILETLLVRKALKSFLPTHKILYKDREPYLSPQDHFISITHSFPFAAVAVSKEKIGIDMEKFNEKILRIEHKFIYSNEANFFLEKEKVEYLTVIWSVKESLYKIHHSNYFSLKQNYKVEEFDLKNLHKINCSVYDENNCDHFSARVEFFEDYCFTIVD